jgi:hypothetical protein
MRRARRIVVAVQVDDQAVVDVMCGEETMVEAAACAMRDDGVVAD